MGPHQRAIVQAAGKIDDINLFTEPTPQKTPSGSPLKDLALDIERLAPGHRKDPDSAAAPPLTRSAESPLLKSFDKKDRSKVRFKEKGQSSEEALLPAFDFSLFEQLMQAKIEQAFTKYFAADVRKDDKIRRQIVQTIHRIVDQHLGDSLEAKVCQQLKEHINCHEVDPTLIALI